ncbi:MAG TPA: CHASE3 domain-containing protein [Pirellulales bacterium]|nr:CHASE3 domain-containing protein [Pirellulales bacterium]
MRSFDRGMLVGIGLVVALLVVNVAITYRNTRTLKIDADWVDHSDLVLDQTANCLLLLVDMETAERGFVITGNEDFLAPYEMAKGQLDECVAMLKELTVDDTRLKSLIEKLEQLKNERVAIVEKTIALRRQSSADAQAFVATKQGKRSMDEIRGLVAGMVQDEHQSRQSRSDLSRSAYHFALTSEVMAGLLALLLFGAFIWYLGRALEARRRDALVIHEQREWFRTTLASIGDGVIATDTEGKVSFLNPIAQSLTGWTEAEAHGQPLETMFKIVNEQSRQTTENPVHKVLRDGIIAGLANHTVLISRDGAECPIEDSAAPIRDEQGAIVGVVLVFHSVSDRREVEGHLKKSEQRFRLAADAVDGIIYDVDMATGNTHRTRGLFEVTGYQPDDVPATVGWWNELIHPDDRPRFEEERSWAMASGADRLVSTYRVQHKDGHWLHVMDRAVLERNAAGKVVRMIGCRVDISEQKQAEAKLLENDRRKDEFLATLAHELRNPLAPLRNALEVMRLDPDNRETFAHVNEIMERQLDHLVRLVDDLLDVSRITRGKIELRKERLDLSKVIESALETSRPLIEAGRHELSVALPPKPIYVLGDLTRLAQVVANLLNNAAKYTPPNGRISLAVERDGGEALIRVRDNGFGIPADMLPTVFDMFTQVERTRERAQGGLGIGLTLVRRLVEMHNGRVEAASEGTNKGSEFVIRLPIALDESPPHQVDGFNHHPATNHLPRRRVLVVDDNDDSLASLAMLVRMMGNDVRTAVDGPTALEAAREFRPEVVLLDVGLPGMNGHEVGRRMREMPEAKGAILVAQTGWGQTEDRRKSAAAGFDAHLVKPVDPAALQKILASLDNSNGELVSG